LNQFSHIQIQAEVATRSYISRALSVVLLLICMSSFLAGIYQSYRYVNYKQNFYQQSKKDLLSLTISASKDIEKILQKAVIAADGLSKRISAGDLTATQMKPALKAFIDDNPLFYGASITFKPYGFDTNKRLHSDYYYRKQGQQEPAYLSLDQAYDYTTAEYDWYVLAMKEGSRWGQPYWDEAGQTYMVTYSTLFYQPDDIHQQAPNGVVTIDISMAQMKNIIENIEIGSSGFGALVTQQGNYLYHPNSDYVKNHLSLLDVAEVKNDPDRVILAEKAANKESGVLDHISSTSGEESWLIYAPVTSSGWSLQNTFIKGDISTDIDEIRRRIIIMLTLLVLFVLSAASLLTKKFCRNNLVNIAKARKAIITFSVLSAIVLLLSTSALWNLALSHANINESDETVLSDRATLTTILAKKRQKKISQANVATIEIPTGIYIDSMEFTNSNNLNITGRIWQKYPLTVIDTIEKGVYFENARDFKLSEPSIQTTEKHQNILWRFQAQIREKIDYSRYPLEVEHIGIEVRANDQHDNVFLVPDLSSYQLLTPTLLPGISKGVFIPGWKLTDSFFSFKTPKEYTSFGIDNHFDNFTLPNLSFNIGIKRVVIDAFFSNLMPLVVVSCILFLVVFLPADVDISRVLGICASLFFAVVFSHLAIRKSIAISEIFYLEYFFFVIYIALLMTPINSIRAANKVTAVRESRGDIILKAAYWPGILAVFYVITFLKFY